MTRRVVVVLLVAALAAGVLGGIVWAYDTWHAAIEDRAWRAGDEAGAARVQQRWDADRARAQAAAIENARLAAAETLRRLNVQQENQRVQDALLARMRSDNAGLAAAVDRLQLRASRYLDAAGCGALAGDPAVACVRAAAAQVVHVLGRCAARHRQLAADADDARARGLKCEADYDALTLQSTAPP